MRREKPCKICRVMKLPHELDAKGRCPSCQDVHSADLAGMHYGDWIAKYKPPKEDKEQSKKEQEANTEADPEEKIYIPGLFCKVCGKPIPLSARSAVTCGDELCRQERARQRRKELYVPVKNKERQCAYCNKPFIPHGAKKKCCSAECSYSYKLERNREYNIMAAARERARRKSVTGDCHG